jgi:RNA polymerase sigma-70 factor (ECF subfamily)
VALQRRQRLNGQADTAAGGDEGLATRASVGDEAAFAELMRRHERRVHALLWRLTRNQAVADELCQETFLRAWRKLGSFQGRGRFEAWLAALAYNVFRKQWRSTRRYAGTLSLEEPGVATEMDKHAAVTAAQEATADLDRLLAVVSPEERELLTLSYAGGLSASEIGAMLNTAPGTVKSQIHRAKQKIRRAFDIDERP